MRWFSYRDAKNKEPKNIRIRRGFLWHPRRVGDEWRWLVFARWTETWGVVATRYIGPIDWIESYPVYGWKGDVWI